MKFFDFIFAARPLLHLPLWSVYLVSLHYHQQLSGDSFSLSDLSMLVLLSLLGAAAFYINQIYDFESDRINNKLGFLQRGYLTEKQLSVGFLICSIVPLALAPFFSVLILAIFAGSFVLAVLYSVPPFKLKDRPLLGLLANALSFGWLVPLTVMPEMTQHNSGLLGWDTPLYFFLSVAAIHILTTIPDRDGDLETGKRTIATYLSSRLAVLIAIIFLIIAAAVAFRSTQGLLVYLSGIAVLGCLPAFLIPIDKFVLFAAKIPILLLTLLAGYFFPIYFGFLVVLIIITRIYYWKRFRVVYPSLS